MQQPATPEEPSVTRVVLWTGVVVIAGALMALQSRVNGELAVVLGDWSAAALLSFGLGTVLLVVAATGSRRRALALPRLLSAVRGGRLRWWHLLGGLGGAVFVAVQSTVVPVVGVAVVTIAIVGGQTVGGLVVDRLGLGPGGAQLITLPRVLGAALVIVAVLVSVGGRVDDGVAWWLLGLPVVSGFLVAFQQAFNGRVRSATDVYAATTGNFAIGLLALAGLFAVLQLSVGTPVDWSAAPWYLYVGGALGLFGIAVSAAAVGVIGVLRLALAIVTGQLTGSIVLDLLLPTPSTAVTGWTFVGLVLAIVAIVLASLPPGTRVRRSSR